MFRLRHTLLVALVAIVALCGVLASGASAATGDSTFGMNPGDVFRLPQSQWDAHLSAMSADGIQTVRMGAWWSDLEPSSPVNGVHNYSFSEVDQRVLALAQHGLRWAPLLSFSPTWDSKISGDYSGAPASNQDFAGFAAALAKRYGRGGSFWSEHPEVAPLPVTSYEIWNEENSTVYWHPGDAGSYADLYAAGRTAIHGVDNSAQVVVGGLAATANGATPAADFLRQMLAARPDLRGNIDAVGFHPYAPDVPGVYAAISAFRHSLDSIAGAGVPLEITEIGWSTTNTSEAQRAANLSTLATTLPRSDCGIDSVAPYAWLGPEQSSSDSEQWFGIENANATAKPSATAYADAVRLMRGLTSTPAPTSTVPVCASPARAAAAATSAPAASTAATTTKTKKRTAAPKLSLRLRQDRKHPSHLRVVARCPAGCRLQVQLITPIKASSAAYKLNVTKSTYSTRSRTVTLKIARHARGTRVRVRVTAITRSGRITHKTKTLRLR
ncbi:MAG: polysaccharide biosynthesis protein PslG [Solirubrobacteraceae bacterium]|nr:polysaccharide biosynthesis protein PslG [Solirubrobacteraceae bacterium]